jgi:hypothetical protein
VLMTPPSPYDGATSPSEWGVMMSKGNSIDQQRGTFQLAEG